MRLSDGGDDDDVSSTVESPKQPFFRVVLKNEESELEEKDAIVQVLALLGLTSFGAVMPIVLLIKIR